MEVMVKTLYELSELHYGNNFHERCKTPSQR